MSKVARLLYIGVMAKRSTSKPQDDVIAKRHPHRDTRVRLEELIKEDRNQTPKELAEALGVSAKRIYVLADAIGYDWIARWKKK